MAKTIRGQHPKRLADHLLTIRQGEKETLRSYVKRFTRETLEVDEADDLQRRIEIQRSRGLTREESSKDDGRDAPKSTEVHER